MLAIHLEPELETRLNHLAKITGKTKTSFAKEAIERHLVDIEKQYLQAPSAFDNEVQEALLSWKHFEETGKSFDWDEQIKPWMESWFSGSEKPDPTVKNRPSLATRNRKSYSSL